MSHKRFIKKLTYEEKKSNTPDNSSPVLSRKNKVLAIKQSEEKSIQPKKKFHEHSKGELLPSLSLNIDRPISSYHILELSNPDYDPPLKRITAIAFNFLTPQDIKNMSVAEINISKFSGENSIYDPRMGLISNFQKCITCNMQWNCCPGHPGSITLDRKSTR